MLACSMGHMELVNMILEAGAYVNAVTPDGRTPLSCAVDHPKVVSVLLKAGADRSIKQEGRNIMDIAKQESFMHSKGRSDTVALLHEAEQLELHQRIAQRRAMEPPDEAKLRLGPMLYEACKAGKLDDANKCIQDEADDMGDEGTKLLVDCMPYGPRQLCGAFTAEQRFGRPD